MPVSKWREPLCHAAIISHLFGSRHAALLVSSSDEASLIDEKGLFTPYYYILRFLAADREAAISTGSDHILSVSAKKISLCIYNANPNSILEAHISFAGLPEIPVIAKTVFGENDNCYSFGSQCLQMDRDPISADTPLPWPENYAIPSGFADEINLSGWGRREYLNICKSRSRSMELMISSSTAILLEAWL